MALSSSPVLEQRKDPPEGRVSCSGRRWGLQPVSGAEVVQAGVGCLSPCQAGSEPSSSCAGPGVRWGLPQPGDTGPRLAACGTAAASGQEPVRGHGTAPSEGIQGHSSCPVTPHRKGGETWERELVDLNSHPVRFRGYTTESQRLSIFSQ